MPSKELFDASAIPLTAIALTDSNFSLIEGIREITVKRMILSVELLAAVVVTIVVALSAYPGADDSKDFSSVLSTYSGVSAAMLGLVIAAYAIFVSLGRPSYLKVLIESGMYKEATTMFAWTSLVLVMATVLALASLSLSDISTMLMWGLFAATSFLTFYGVLCVGVLAVSSLRIINELRMKFLIKTNFEDK